MLERTGEAFLTFLQRLLHPLALGDVGGYARQTDNLARRIPDFKAADLNPTGLVIRPDDAILDVQAWCVTCELGKGGLHAVAILGKDKVSPLMWIGIQAFCGTAPNPLKRRTDIMQLLHVRRTDPEHIGNVFRHLAELFLALTKFLLRLAWQISPAGRQHHGVHLSLRQLLQTLLCLMERADERSDLFAKVVWWWSLIRFHVLNTMASPVSAII